MENKIIKMENENKITLNEIWYPGLGPETLKLREYFRSKGIDEKSIENLSEEAQKILANCGSPTEKTAANTGLAFGYVQSGKTMSFTTLATLAKDNNFPLIIIIAGVTTNLVNQSTERIEKDLQLNERYDRKWLAIPNPKLNQHKNIINSAIMEWRDESFPKDKRKTVLITVMKQKNHLPNLIKLLEKIDLEDIPTLIIDDEGDQASLNNKEGANARNASILDVYEESEISKIYKHVLTLKSTLPHHTFIQYTATPQAPLFIHKMNNLSPNFIELLTPGDTYTGGKTFFSSDSNLIRIIPQSQIGTNDEPLTKAPQSMREAMQIFFLGVAEGYPGNKFKNRSMLLHPSHLTDKHEDYLRFAKIIKGNFVDLLSLNDGEKDKEDLLKEFRKSHDDLSKTVDDLPTFEELIENNNLLHSIRATQIRQVNSRNKLKVNWRDVYSHILVGGFKMDRGFTIEGLTVTYMPRSRGVGNADTIQQRARFFGYKKGYIGLCRVYLDATVKRDYIQYNEHEEDMRQRLEAHIETKKPLNDWYREVFLDRDFRLTRPSVIYNELERSRFGTGWFAVKSPHENENICNSNREVLKKFIEKVNLDYYEEESDAIEIPLKDALDFLLNRLRFTHIGDITHYSGLLYVLQKYAENVPNEKCTIYYISSFENPRVRGLNKKDQIKQLFQGRNKKSEGMREIKSSSGISIQVHVLNLKSYTTKEVIHENIPTVAINTPTSISTDLIRWKTN